MQKKVLKFLAYLLLSWLHLQDVLFPDGVEHATLPAEVSEALLFVVPVHLYNIKEHRFTATIYSFPYLSNDLKGFYLGSQAQDEHGETLHDRGVLVKQQWQPC